MSRMSNGRRRWLAGAVAGPGVVIIEQPSGASQVQATTTGSFFATVKTQLGANLAIRFESSDPIVKQVQLVSGPVQVAPGPISGVPPITVVAPGRVRIQGQTTLPDSPVVAANTANGDVVAAQSGSNNRLTLEISASTGDRLFVYNDDTQFPLSEPWELIAP